MTPPGKEELKGRTSYFSLEASSSHFADIWAGRILVHRPPKVKRADLTSREFRRVAYANNFRWVLGSPFPALGVGERRDRRDAKGSDTSDT
jgi:hypothetical protein